MKSRLEKYLPRPDSLPTNEKDFRDAKWSAAYQTTGLLFANEQSKKSVDINLSILDYKKRDINTWINHQLNLGEEIRATVKRRKY